MNLKSVTLPALFQEQVMIYFSISFFLFFRHETVVQKKDEKAQGGRSYLLFLFQIIIGHENSEPRVTQLCVQFPRVLSFSGARDVAILCITDWKWCCVFPDVLYLSQPTIGYTVTAFRSYVVSQIYLKQ